MRLLRSHAGRSIVAATLVTLLTIAGCSGEDPVAPPALSGEWQLVAVNGDDLPVVIAQEHSATTSITAGRLDFRTRGRVLDVQTYFIVTNFGAREVGPDTVAVAYELSGDQIILKRRYLGGRTFSDTGQVDIETGGMLLKARDLGPKQDGNFVLIYHRI